MNVWPKTWRVNLSEGFFTELPLVRSDDGFGIYALDMMGQTVWSQQCAEALADKLKTYDFDIILTAEAKAIGLAQALANHLNHPEYVVLRKATKLYMPDPISVEVKSITTTAQQTFYLGQDKVALLKDKRVCVLDDVISTGGTLHAMLQITKLTDCMPVVIAVVLTEETEWQEFDGVPVVSLDHIPLPGLS